MSLCIIPFLACLFYKTEEVLSPPALLCYLFWFSYSFAEYSTILIFVTYNANTDELFAPTRVAFLVDFFSQTAARICFKFSVVRCSLGGPLLILSKWGATSIFHGIIGNFVQFLANS